eukprot:10815947-Prorocentrum_lima.AAC.1
MEPTAVSDDVSNCAKPTAAVVSSSSNMEPAAVFVAMHDVSNCAKPFAEVFDGSLSNLEPAAVSVATNDVSNCAK